MSVGASSVGRAWFSAAVFWAFLLCASVAQAVTVTASPSSCTNSGSGNDWSNTSRAYSSNNSYSTVALNDWETSEYLQCTGFGFAIPTGSTINGITVKIERKAGTANRLADSSMMVVKGGSRTGDDKAATATYYPTSDDVATYGGAGDLWGTSWSVDDINSSNFGAALSVTKPTSSDGGITASVDHIQIVVDYSEPLPAVVSINRSGFDPANPGDSVTWSVVFNVSATGVDAGDFVLAQSGGVSGASITSVSGSGSTWTVTANTGTGAGGLRLDLIDDDSILSAGGVPLGGVGTNNGNFSGQSYTIELKYCDTLSSALFCDDFERSNAGSLGNGWTVSPANTSSSCDGTTGNIGCAGIDRDIPPFDDYTKTHATTTRSMFTRWAAVTADSPTIDLSGRPAALLSFWMRRGSDTFSECPEASGENYLVLYWNGTDWKTLAQYRSSPSAALCGDGEVFTPTIQLPPDALHANFKLRFSQPSGSGDSGSGGASGVRGYDYWHMDNIAIVEAPASSYTGAFCDNFEGGLGRWSVTAEDAPTGASIGDVRLGTTDYKSAGHELDFRWGYAVASTLRTDMSGITGDITYWVKSGGGSTDRAPDSGEDLVAEYFNSSGTWTQLARYYANGSTTGTSYDASFPIPADAKHAGFRLRFRQLGGSGYDKDYWHVDDVCVGSAIPEADLSLTKTRGAAALVPGSTVTYTLTVTNNGPGAIVGGTLEIVDTLPATLSLVSATGSGWNCSANGQKVTCSRVGSLAIGASAPAVTLVASLSPSATGSLTNSATVSGTVIDNAAANNTATNTGNIVSATLIARYHLEETAWNGTSGEVKDDAGYAGGPYNGAALGSSSPLPTPTVGSPARTGSPGTCGYAALPGPAANGGTITLTGLPVSISSGAKTSVAFWMYWDGTDNVMPLGWSQYALKFSGGAFGFHTGNGDIYGIDATGLANGWHHVVAVFTNGGVTSNQLFIDAVSQTLSQRSGSPNNGNALVGASLRLGGWTNDSNHRFSGRLDEVLIYKDALVAADVADIYAATHVCAVAVDHYELSLPTNSINCLTTTATVTACSDSAAPCAKSLVVGGQTAKLTADGGTLAPTSVIFDSLGTATATLSYPTAANGAVVKITLSDEQTAAQNPRKCCPNGTNCVVRDDCSTTFNTAGFIFSATANGGVATLPAQVAGTASGTYYLRAVKTSDNSAHTCGGALSGAQKVDMAYECNNPITCYGANLLNGNGGGPTATTITRNNNGAVPYSYTEVNFTFDADGNAPFTFNYNDVGQVTLRARKTLTAAGTVAAATLSGTSNAFVVKPGGFALSNIKQTASPNLANPGAADANGAKFVKAGEAFSVTVTAQTSAGDTAYSYGQETTPEGVKLSSTLVTGLGLSNNPNLSNNTAFGGFANGVATGTIFAWDEVGIITLTPSVGDGDYLGEGNIAGDTAGKPSGKVGRFYPDHFVLSAASVTPAVGGTFTYMGQPFEVTAPIEARNLGEAKTANYSGDFAKGTVIFAAENANNGTDLFARLTGLAGAWSNGTYTLSTPKQIRFVRSAAPDGAYDSLVLSVKVTDPDGSPLSELNENPTTNETDATCVLGPPANVTGCTHKIVGSIKQRFGRLRLLNAYGSELLEPRVEYRAEYWNGTRWTTNTDDATSSVAAANIFATPNTSPTVKSVTGLTSGVGQIIFNKAGAGFFDIAVNLNATGIDTSCNVAYGPYVAHGGTAANMPWLQAYWGAPASCGGVAAWAQDPNARVKLGSPRAPYIYLRERY